MIRIRFLIRFLLGPSFACPVLTGKFFLKTNFFQYFLPLHLAGSAFGLRSCGHQRCRDRRAIEIDRDRSIAVVRSRSRSSIAEKKRDRDRDRLVFRSSIAEFDRAKNWQIGNVVLLSKCVQSVVFIVSAEQSSTLKWNRKLIK